MTSYFLQLWHPVSFLQTVDWQNLFSYMPQPVCCDLTLWPLVNFCYLTVNARSHLPHNYVLHSPSNIWYAFTCSFQDWLFLNCIVSSVYSWCQIHICFWFLCKKQSTHLSYCGSLQYRDLHKAQTASYKKIAGWLTQDKYFQLKFGVIHQA